jgi:hypothetical protein
LDTRETDRPKNIFGWFFKPSWAEEKRLESSRTSRGLRKVAEFRKSNWRSTIVVPELFLVRNSAIDFNVRNVAELRRWGLKLRMPTFVFYPAPQCPHRN